MTAQTASADSPSRLVLTIRSTSVSSPAHQSDLDEAMFTPRSSVQPRDRNGSRHDLTGNTTTTPSQSTSSTSMTKPLEDSIMPKRKASLSHYQQQLMHLERLNKKRLHN